MADRNGAGSMQADVELQELCQLLVGMDRERLYAAIQRLENRHEFAEHLSTVLAEAMRLGAARDEKIGEALAPIVSKGVHETVKRDPTTFGKALAPAMGPAIRQAVMQMFRGLVETFERTMEHSLSPRGWKWRFEAWRTGKSFAEVVFLHTLAYRVEHVFLIHRVTGLLLQHASIRDLGNKDPDLISGMLTAIQDFVGDAFDSAKGDRLDRFQVGELTVFVEHTERAILAAVIRGQALARIRLNFRASLENIEMGFSNQLDDFDGDVEPFEAVLPELEMCLLSQELQQKERPKKSKLGKSILVVVTIGLLAWLVVWWIQDTHDASRFADYVARLRGEPGIVVTQSERGERYRVAGLRDPLAADPLSLAPTGLVRARVDLDFAPYQALDADMVLRRAERVLAPPKGAWLRLEGATLHVLGVAEAGWMENVRRVAVALPGVERLDTTELKAK